MLFFEYQANDIGSPFRLVTYEILSEKIELRRKRRKWTRLVNRWAIFPGPPSPHFESIIGLLCRTVAERLLQQPECRWPVSGVAAC